MSASQKDVARVHALIELAADERAPLGERENAAVKACVQIKHGKMVVGAVDEDGILRTQGGPEARGERRVRVSVELIVMTETTQAYRVAYATPQSKTQGSRQAGWVPKRILVGKPELYSAEEAKSLYGVVRPVIRSVTVLERDVETLTRAIRSEKAERAGEAGRGPTQKKWGGYPFQ